MLMFEIETNQSTRSPSLSALKQEKQMHEEKQPNNTLGKRQTNAVGYGRSQAL